MGLVQIANASIGTIIGAMITSTARARAQANANAISNRLNRSLTYETALYYYGGLYIPMTARVMETYQYRADLTENAIENGAIVSDHLIQHPMQIELSFEAGNADGLGQDAYVASSALDAGIARITSGQYFDLVTTHRYLKNMVCTNLHAENSAEAWGALKFRATFKQLGLANLVVVKYDPSNVYGNGWGQSNDAKVAAVGMPAGNPNGDGAVPPSPRVQKRPVQVSDKTNLMNIDPLTGYPKVNQ